MDVLFSPFTSTESKKNTDNFPFWGNKQQKVPGITVKQVRGAQYPPLTETPPNSAASSPHPKTGNNFSSKSQTENSEKKIEEVENNKSESESNNENENENEKVKEKEKQPLNDYGSSKLSKFEAMLNSPNMNFANFKTLCWLGVPQKVRPTVWKLLLGYLPVNPSRRQSTLDRKRHEYIDFVSSLCLSSTSIDQQHNHPNKQEGNHYPPPPHLDDEKLLHNEQVIYKQIHIDIPRTSPGIPLFQNSIVQEALKRILFAWSIRHPATGYVQGINDLATPFFTVFLSEYVENPETCDIQQLSPSQVSAVEADTFWCMTHLLDRIQDHYTFAQPGIQLMIFKLEELVKKIDFPLYHHLKEQGAEFIQFGFRWMNCLLLRELPLPLAIRMWDTYLSETNGFSSFHVYVCAALLLSWSEKLRQLEFQDIMMFLQHVPTNVWTYKEVEMVLSQAYYYQTLYKDAPMHLNTPDH